MEYRKVGKSGLLVSELSLGSWLTFGAQLDIDNAREAMREAYRAGINFFDTAEAYASGMAESMMGEILKEFKREEVVVSTKIFWGGNKPNQKGLSRKHLLEGTWNSLKRLQLNYVDILFAHRPDPEVPMEEIVLGMDYIVRNGLAFYWGTSEWSSKELEEAHKVADRLNAIHPVVEQPQYNMFVRERVESEYRPIYEKYGLGLTVWSPLASGLLTGKYNKGIPEDSRLAKFPGLKKHLEENKLFSSENLKKVERLAAVAKKLDTELAQLALAWILKNENVSSIILGVSKVQQLRDNLKALDVKDKLTEEIVKEINSIIE
ncbi:MULTISPECIES: aldo/keto reductase [Mesotoga]|uniref:potassium channel beta subunit family protein n=1 Tax=Mesotoga TaxID=1184396 RepID=UPI000EF138BF|nr:MULTISPECIES: aldo/keto reductase [Mesotoga]MCP5457268.1 aldo/keto reductase [Thermotogota bacterium]MCB1222397.1 aldo/keto reductase [Mesotoga sp.]MCP5461142.1 aldo/keto reductase [Thermotogota bacterium]RLL84181.1 alcohol dehydrogenase [Mesotoga sp. H07pep.5.4]HNQ71334.1 aldo/keto reductase [Mesotoga prima]